MANRADGRGRPARDLTEAVLRNAMKHTQSNMQAARYLNVTIDTYRKYAKLYIDKETGKTLYELHKNGTGKGISRIRWRKEYSLEKLESIVTSDSYRAFDQQKLKARLIYEGILRQECYKCGHNEKRVVDYRQPLILSFKDGNKHNWKLDNVEMLCYNCYFLFVGNLYTDKQVHRLEDANAPLIKKAEVDWSIDESFLQHFKDIGLDRGNDYLEGDEFISRI